MLPKSFLFIFLLLLVPIGFAADEYKPYLHQASVPEHPKIVLYGQYKTNLFPGAATYSLPIETPKGTNNLQPSLTISYNSQAVNQRPGIVGAGWSITQNYIYRDINFTSSDTSDDEFTLILEGNSYELIYGNDSFYHTEVDYYFKVENLTGAPNNYSYYWLLTKKDGTKYRFGYNSDSELTSNTGKSYALKWSLDLVEDTHGNKIYYSYLEDPNNEDQGAVYLNNIKYNNDQKREIRFSYENSTRPDRRLVFEQGNKLEENRRLTDITVYADNNIIRRYHINYIILNPTLTSISKINQFGSDNSSIFYNISFDYYSAQTGYENTTSWTPPYYFSNNDGDYGIRLVDIDRDGYTDLIRGCCEGSYDPEVWLNNKNNNWTNVSSWVFPEYIVAPTPGNRIDNGVRLVDLNNDGFIDILKSRQYYSKKAYLNNKTGWVDNTSQWNIPYYFVDSDGNDLGVMVVDINNDGKADIVKSTPGEKAVFFNNGSGWTQSSWSVPTNFVDNNEDQGARLLDVNGDGLTDILKAKDGTRNAWLNDGTAWVNYDVVWKPPIDFVTTSVPDEGVRFADVNGDGLVDILEDYINASDVTRKAWINNGSGWQQNDSWASIEAFTKNGYNIGRRLADINGDSLVDIVIANDTSNLYSRIKNSGTPYLLKSVVNEYGGVTNINYTTSTQFNNSVNGTSQLGFNVFVVRNVTTNNSLNMDFNVLSSTNYNYSNGKYNYENYEFRGFGLVQEKKPSALVKHYLLQDDARKGKEYKTEIYNLSNNLYLKTEKEYISLQANGIYNVSLSSLTNYQYDGFVNATVTNKSYVYDGYGNLLYLSDYGDISVEDDEKYYNYSYGYNTNNWIMDRLAKVGLYDEGNEKVKETKYYYDNKGLNGVGSKGELTKTEGWNNNGNNTYAYFEYDNYGNLKKKTDSYGNSYTYSYEATHTYLSSIVNPLGHVTFYDYDLATGNLNYEEKNGIRKNYYYDIFGRIVKEVMPYDTNLSPTKNYSYYFDGNAPEYVKVSMKTTADKTNEISYYYDGFANLVQIKSDTEDKQIVKNIFYDSSYRASHEQNPYFADAIEGLSNVSSSVNITNYTYDVLDRVIKVLNPDGTSKNISFEKYNITDYDENGNKHLYVLDAYGRIINVYEYNTNDVDVNETYITSYEYDANDNLVKIIDSLGNEFSFTYDSLGRKIKMDDPDLGNWSYGYDKNGNLLRQQDARGNVTLLSYDALNRVVSKNSSNINMTFYYDKDYQGTLSNITTKNISFTYGYDKRLRVVKQNEKINNLSFETSFIYDSQDRLISKAGLGEVDYIFNKQGKVQKIPGFINDSYYSAFGSILNRTYNNNLVATFSYNSENNRLTSIKIPNVQNLTYTYDSVGNILTITDAIQNRNHILTYDNLDRLFTATVGNDRYVYSYNQIGNMMKIVKNNQSKKFVYNNLAHAPSSIIEGSAGVDIYNVKELTNTSKNRSFEFYLVNDKNTTLNNVKFSVDFGDGNVYSNNSGISINDYVKVAVENTYANGGNYFVNVSANSSGITDKENLAVKFGARAIELQTIYSNVSERIFEFVVHNDVSEMIYNVSWNCSDGISSIYSANLTGNQSLFDYIAYNYSTPGEKIFTCSVVSNDGTDYKTITFTIKGLEIENYDILFSNISRRIIAYDVNNYFNPVLANITMSANGQNFSRTTNISSNEKVMVFAEVNYSGDGAKTFNIEVKPSNYSQKYIDSFTLEGVSIEDYARIKSNYVSYILIFNLVNKWYSGRVNWSISDPSLANYTNLNNNESALIVIENNYSQGNKNPEINAFVSSFVAKVKDFFEVRPLEIAELNTLSEGLNSVTEIIVKNNLNNTQQFSWKFNTGIQNVTSSNLTNITSNDVFIYIQSNYSNENVYRTTATINSTSYNDNETGVIVS